MKYERTTEKLSDGMNMKKATSLYGDSIPSSDHLLLADREYLPFTPADLLDVPILENGKLNIYYERKNHFTELVNALSKADECNDEDECLYDENIIFNQSLFPTSDQPPNGESSNFSSEQLDFLTQYNVGNMTFGPYGETDMKEMDDKGYEEAIAAFNDFNDNFVFKSKPFICDFDNYPDADDMIHYIPPPPAPIARPFASEVETPLSNDGNEMLNPYHQWKPSEKGELLNDVYLFDKRVKVMQLNADDFSERQVIYIYGRRALLTCVDYPLIFWKYIDVEAEHAMAMKVATNNRQSEGMPDTYDNPVYLPLNNPRALDGNDIDLSRVIVTDMGRSANSLLCSILKEREVISRSETGVVSGANSDASMTDEDSVSSTLSDQDHADLSQSVYNFDMDEHVSGLRAVRPPDIHNNALSHNGRLFSGNYLAKHMSDDDLNSLFSSSEQHRDYTGAPEFFEIDPLDRIEPDTSSEHYHSDAESGSDGDYDRQVYNYNFSFSKSQDVSSRFMYNLDDDEDEDEDELYDSHSADNGHIIVNPSRSLALFRDDSDNDSEDDDEDDGHDGHFYHGQDIVDPDNNAFSLHHQVSYPHSYNPSPSRNSPHFSPPRHDFDFDAQFEDFDVNFSDIKHDTPSNADLYEDDFLSIASTHSNHVNYPNQAVDHDLPSEHFETNFETNFETDFDTDFDDVSLGLHSYPTSTQSTTQSIDANSNSGDDLTDGNQTDDDWAGFDF